MSWAPWQLEHEAASCQADVGAFGLRQFRGRLAADDDVALGRRIEQADLRQGEGQGGVVGSHAQVALQPGRGL